jgi:hypothetical protein
MAAEIAAADDPNRKFHSSPKTKLIHHQKQQNQE